MTKQKHHCLVHTSVIARSLLPVIARLFLTVIARLAVVLSCMSKGSGNPVHTCHGSH